MMYDLHEYRKVSYNSGSGELFLEAVLLRNGGEVEVENVMPDSGETVGIGQGECVKEGDGKCEQQGDGECEKKGDGQCEQ
ncbi:hypothetical protein LR48_Vigan10g171700 [Vigna angularis]|uniref:Uncharacterized protein n=1 Tax=Phaseolus angularis TaxID=3914 RepID=A0A0L9VLA0_PHAAN|nr:hypothetical protein LR48_Vigan10g171700 [Vigna angularis]